ncbi:hypothetical protein E3N88_38754 [Mikania micrantha]|uniref:Uncharacterized protein n=1 Tax=Mikania micrantha TaxID=192012 RepID=A0A5N6LUY9_9ASTR|nr:hypothetical protein E3N88_38754 [Mikania micrantha]
MVVAALVAPGPQRFEENKVMVMIFKPTNLPLQASCEFLASIFKYGSSNGFQWVKNACSSWLGRDFLAISLSGVPPSEELWLQAYGADDLHLVLSFPTRAYRLGSLVGLKRTAWNSRQAQ